MSRRRRNPSHSDERLPDEGGEATRPPVERSPTRHDQLLKTVLATFFQDLVDLVDPELAREIESDSLEHLDKEVFTDLPEGKRREVDLLVRARLRSGTDRLVLVHVEIESAYRSTHPARMARYFYQIRGRHPEEPVLPIAVYLRGGPVGHEIRTWSDVIADFEVVRFRYHALGLKRDLAEHHLERPNPLGWALASLMKSDRFRPAEHKLECLRRIAGAGFDEARKFLLVNLVETYLELTGDEWERYNRSLANEANEEVRAMQLTWEEKHYHKGLLEGSRRTLTRLIEERLGALPPRSRERLAAIDDADELDRLASRLLRAKSFADLGLDA